MYPRKSPSRILEHPTNGIKLFTIRHDHSRPVKAKELNKKKGKENGNPKQNGVGAKELVCGALLCLSVKEWLPQVLCLLVCALVMTVVTAQRGSNQDDGEDHVDLPVTIVRGMFPFDSKITPLRTLEMSKEENRETARVKGLAEVTRNASSGAACGGGRHGCARDGASAGHGRAGA